MNGRSGRVCSVCSVCSVCLTVLSVCGLVKCATRTYYIGIEEIDWNYAPKGRNLIKNLDIKDDKFASVYLQHGPQRIGSVYKKAVYKQYTDQTYSTEIPKPDWLGFVGPVIKAELGDDLVIHLRNNASRPYSLHPHGVFYQKDSEGALYPDGTSGDQKLDDAVEPGKNFTYRWKVTEDFSPTKADSNCLTWIYHSHVDSPKDIASGLIGPLLTCKPGTLKISDEFILMFSVVDENLSWYLKNNINTFCTDPATQREDEEFQESNRMHSINGFVYGNLPVLNVHVGCTVTWHIFSVGNEVDLHSVYFHGHTLLDRGHRTDVLSVFPATTVTALMVPRTPGTWMLGCQVNKHMQAGMQGFYKVSPHEVNASPALSGHTRHYYIAAEEELWDYAPSGINTFTGQNLTEDNDSKEFFSKEYGMLGGKYWKVRYVQYTSDSFTERMNREGSDQHLGILGPVIRAETGDTIEITFRNKARYNFSMQPHGVTYDKVSEGAMYQDGTEKRNASVAPGQTTVYRWRVTEGPSPTDPPCLSYLYYSATDPVRDTNSGLIGPLQVCKKKATDESGRQHFGPEVQKEFFLLFTVMDENESWYLEQNIKEFGNAESDPESPYFTESNRMHSVNGLMYGNLPFLDLCEGDHVVWHMLGLGTEVDIHGVYFHGNMFQRDNTNHDTLSLFPHTSVTVSMSPNNDGKFELGCVVTDHHRGGMRQYYTVKRCSKNQSPEQDSATFQPNVYYYIAAEEVEWNYAPNRTWELERHTGEHSPGSVFLNKSENRIGPVYKKVVYCQYTDETFTTKTPRGSQEEHLGILGPILRVQVGEKVQVVFKNDATIPYSIHAHGVKSREADLKPVQPGQVMKYNWTISVGPGPSDPGCIAFAYYSSVSLTKDLASGLVGPLVVCREGTLNSDRRRTDVDKDFALLFMVFDENESWYLDENIKTYLQKDPDTFNTNDEEFIESNMMHGINGKMYANLQGLEMKEGDRTEWYLMGLGSEMDIHTVHFHAHSFVYKMDHEHRADVYELIPGTFKTVKLVAGTPGTWLLHCHVADHIHAGMETTFTIQKLTKDNRKIGVTPGSGCSCLQKFEPTLLFLTLIFLIFINQ